MSKGYYKSKGWSSQQGIAVRQAKQLDEELRSIINSKRGGDKKPVIGKPNGSKERYYVVLVGRRPGIYLTWRECEEQVSGFPKSKYRKYFNVGPAMRSLELGNWVDDRPSRF